MSGVGIGGAGDECRGGLVVLVPSLGILRDGVSRCGGGGEGDPSSNVRGGGDLED
jgi:hypothetical protein